MVVPNTDPERTRALHYFGEIIAVFQDLHSIKRDTETRMKGLVDEYRRTMRRSSLVLFLERRRRNQRPYAVYWGRLLGREINVPKFADSPASVPEKKKPKRWIKHLGARLERHHVYYLAKNAGYSELFFDFDRRASALNDAHKSVVRALLIIRNTLTARYVPSDVPRPPVPLPPVDVPDRETPALRAAWALVHVMATVETALLRLVAEHKLAPPDPRIALDFVRDPKCRTRAQWTLRSLGRRIDRMTERLMRELRVPRSARRELRCYEARRRPTMREHKRHADVLSKIQKRSAESLSLADRRLQECERNCLLSNP